VALCLSGWTINIFLSQHVADSRFALDKSGLLNILLALMIDIDRLASRLRFL